MRSSAAGPVALLLAGVLLAAVPGPGASQESGELEGREEALLLREASVLESRGRFGEAERRLRHLLEEDAGVAAAVFGLERVLRRQGRLPEILPYVDRYLEARPSGTAVRQLELRLLAEMDSLDALEGAAREWIRRDPSSLEPYRKILPVFHEAFGPDRALELVKEARESTGRRNALALEAGDILARRGDHQGAGREWSRAIGEEGRSLSRVLGRIDELPGETGELVSTLLEDLEGDTEVSTARLRGAARLALAAGIGDRAVEIADGVLDRLEGRTRKGFLVQFAQRAEERGARDPALWAYERLRQETAHSGEARSLDERISELALAAGDTARALAARERIVASREPGSVERRRAVAAHLDLEVERLDPAGAADRITDFRSRFPDAPELDGLAARVARRLISDGKAERAGEILSGVEGPRSALERAYLRLEAGEVEKGVTELDSALAGLSPMEATGIVDLLSFLEGAGPRGAELAGRVAALAHRGRSGAALTQLREEIDGVSLDDRPGLLALGARLADEAGETKAASTFRARLIREFPEAPEAPEAAVRLARSRAGDPEGDRKAARILEELILNRPESAVVPEARRELEKLRARIPEDEGR